MLCRFIQAGAFLVLLAGTAAAQDNQEKPGIPLNYKPPPTQEQIDKRKADEQAYEKAVQKIPDKKSSADPWGTIRPTTPAASKSKQQ